jgi:hypothetical protein
MEEERKICFLMLRIKVLECKDGNFKITFSAVYRVEWRHQNSTCQPLLPSAGIFLLLVQIG